MLIGILSLFWMFSNFFSSQKFHFQFTPSYDRLPAYSHVYLLHSWHAVCSLQHFQYIQAPIIKVLSSWYSLFLNFSLGTFLVVQWLRLWAPEARGLGSIPGQGTGPHRPQPGVQESQPKVPQATTRSQCSQIFINFKYFKIILTFQHMAQGFLHPLIFCLFGLAWWLRW